MQQQRVILRATRRRLVTPPSDTTPMLVFDEETLLKILDDIFDEIKRDYEIILPAKPLSMSASPNLVINKTCTCREAIDNMLIHLNKLKLDVGEDEPSANESAENESLSGCDFIFEGTDDGFHYIHEESDNVKLPDSSDKSPVKPTEGTKDGFLWIHDQYKKPKLLLVPIANSTDNSLKDSSDKSPVKPTEGTKDGFLWIHDQNNKPELFLVPIANSTDNSLKDSSDKSPVKPTERTENRLESSHGQNKEATSFLVPMANSTDNSLNNHSDESSDISTEGTEDGFELSDDQNETSVVSTLKHVNAVIRKADYEINSLNQLKSQANQILSNISKHHSSRRSSPFPVYNLSTSRFIVTNYAMRTHADIIKILEPKLDQNTNGKSNYYRKYIIAQRVPPKRAAALLRKIKIERRTRCVFVENIDYPIETIVVVDHFTSCGALECVLVYRGENGYALLEFKNTISAHAAIAMDGTLFRGRTINVMAIEAVGQQGIRIEK